MLRWIHRATSLIYLAAVLIAAGGLVAWLRDQENLAAWPQSAFASQALWIALGGWWLCLILAQLFSSLAKGPTRVEPLPSSDEQPPSMAPALETGGELRERHVERLRLEALMRGEHPEPAAVIDEAVAAAVAAGASDLHFQPAGQECRVTLRVRGELRPLATYPIARHGDVVRRLKVLAKLPPYLDDQPQDARISLTTPHGQAQVRLSTVPSQDGERLALRLAGDATLMDLGALGLLDEDREKLEGLLAEPQGMLILSGPTGCGKTTTLYSCLQHIHRHRGDTVAIASIEDPIEVDVPFAHQVPVDRGRNMSFAGALRSVLRQDPNVLMLGEIRDGETARTAVQAGLSGHLILTTLHADSNAGVFPRLIDLGAEPFLAASATLACVTQRLARRLCPECRHPRTLPSEQRRLLEQQSLDPQETFFTAEGCAACDHRGTAGRVAVFEILTLDAELRRLIAARTPAHELAAAGQDAGHGSLLHGALRLAATGEISFEEAVRVAT